MKVSEFQKILKGISSDSEIYIREENGDIRSLNHVALEFPECNPTPVDVVIILRDEEG